MATTCWQCGCEERTEIGRCLCCGAAKAITISQRIAMALLGAPVLAGLVGAAFESPILFIVTWVAAAGLSIGVRFNSSDLGRVTVNGFVPSKFYWHANKGIALAEDNRHVLVVAGSKGAVLGPEDIANVAIAKDGTEITSGSNAAMVARGAVGAVLAGGVGLLAGALTGRKQSAQKVSRLELKIVTRNPASPLWTIDFLNRPLMSNAPEFRDAVGRIEQWHATVVALASLSGSGAARSAHLTPY